MEEKDDKKFEEFLQNLHQKYAGGLLLYQYKGFWLSPEVNLKGMRIFCQHFKPNDSDIILASYPKSGTTWLKSLTFSIVYRKQYSISESPLRFNNPHQLIHFAEANEEDSQTILDGRRIIASHLPYQCLPNSVLHDSSCRIIYICRNLLDVFTSTIPFFSQNPSLFPSKSLEETFEAFCEGTTLGGPVWNHILGYWEASLKDPHKVLFLKYEDLVKDTSSYVRKMAEFLGCPFSLQEENEGLVEEVTQFCSLENLRSLECNTKGEIIVSGIKAKSSSYFRKGLVGDWVNFLTPSMAERLRNLMTQRFDGSGLSFDIHA